MVLLALTTGTETPGGRSDGSLAGATPAALRTLLEEEFRPEIEERERWQTRVLRLVGQLERLGEAVAEEDLQRIIRRGGYAEKMQGMDLSQQVGFLKTTFGEVLLDEERYEEIEYNGRLGALMDMLRSRGTEMSTSVHKMFSGFGSKAGSACLRTGRVPTVERQMLRHRRRWQ